MKQLAKVEIERPVFRPHNSGAGRAWLILASVLTFMAAVACYAVNPAPAEFLKTGQAAMEDGFYGLAEGIFQSYLASTTNGTPESDRAAILLAKAYHGQKKFTEMIALLSPVGDAASAYWRAMAQYELKQYDKVAVSLADFSGKYRNDSYAIHALRLLADCHLQNGNTNEALQVFAQINAMPGNQADHGASTLDWARTLTAAGQHARAQDVLSRLIARSPETDDSRQARLLLCRILTNSGNPKEAETVLAPLIEQGDVEPAHKTAALILLAGIRESQGKLAEATNALSTAVGLAPDRLLKRRGEIALGGLLLKMKQLDEGAAMLKPYIAANPPDPAAQALQIELAAAFLQAGDADRAVEAYQHYLETFSDKPGRAEAFSGKGWALLLRQKPAYEEAADAFRQAYLLFTAPADKVKCLIKTADCRFSNGQFGLAAQAYEQVLSDFPDSTLVPQAMFQIAECAARTKKPVDAEKFFRTVIATNPAGPFADQALLRIAEIKEDQGELTAALAVYDQLMTSYTNSALWAEALLARGLINYRSLLFETALGDFEKLVNRFPQAEAAEQAAYLRCRCLQVLGPEEKSLAAWRTFLHTYPASKKWTPQVLFRLGEYAFNHGSFKEAEKQFADIAAVYTNSTIAPAALLAAGRSAAKQKEYLNSIEYFSKLVTIYPSWPGLAKARYEQGDATTELGEYAKAILIFEEIINKHGGSDLVEMAWFRKADCEFALGTGDTNRYESAIASYKLVAEKSLAPPDLKLQAQYKIGACLQKMQRYEEAMEQLYSKVMIPYLDDPRQILREYPACQVWFTRAAFDIVERRETQKKWQDAIRILKRIVDAGVPAADEAKKRIDKIRLQLWILP
ncbi:MAG: tetratricopeptide repeat protein [bacterium]